MTPITLEYAFNAFYHGKLSFEDFCECSPDAEYTEKFNGRKICVPSEKYKEYLRFLNGFVFEAAPVSDAVHSYRTGRSNITAMRPHADGGCFLITDIERFFDSFSAGDAETDIRAKMDHRIPISDIRNYADRILEMVTVGDSLPVGFPTSPLITNTYLFEFDRSLQEYCSRRKITYARYSDDLILSADTKDALRGCKEAISELLVEHAGKAFQLSRRKTRWLHRGQKIDILGLSVLPSGRISVGRRQKSRMELLLHFYVTRNQEGYLDCLAKFFHSNPSALRGYLSYLGQIDPEYLDKLQKKYGSFVVDYLRHEAVHAGSVRTAARAYAI